MSCGVEDVGTKVGINRIDVHRLRETTFIRQAGFDKVMDGIATMIDSAQGSLSLGTLGFLLGIGCCINH